MSDKSPGSCAVSAVHRLIGTPRGLAIYLGLLSAVVGTRFMRVPRGSPGFTCGLMTTIMGTSCLGTGLLQREGRMYQFRRGTVVFLGSSGMLSLMFLAQKNS